MSGSGLGVLNINLIFDNVNDYYISVYKNINNFTTLSQSEPKCLGICHALSVYWHDKKLAEPLPVLEVTIQLLRSRC
jgi:hypothetical protein